MPKLKFHAEKSVHFAPIHTRLDRWEADFPDPYVPVVVTLLMPGDRTGMTTDKKLHLDAREIEMQFVCTKIEWTEEGEVAVAHYHLSTPERPLKPYRPLMD